MKGRLVWGNCLKYLKRGWNRKRGGKTEILKRGEAWSSGGCPKNWGLERPYELWFIFIDQTAKRFTTTANLRLLLNRFKLYIN